MVGLTTYPLYLIHDNFGAVALRTLLDRGFNRLVALGAAVSLCIVSGFFVAIILEPPIQRVIRIIFDRAISARHAPLPSGLSRLVTTWMNRSNSLVIRHREHSPRQRMELAD